MIKEEWSYIVVSSEEDKIHDWYSISNHGNLATHLYRKPLGKQGFKTFIDRNKFTESICTSKLNNDGTVKAVYKNMTFPPDFFERYDYSRACKSENINKTMYIHTMVMDAFKPMSQNPPERLAEEWFQVITPDMVGQPRIPEHYKRYIREGSIVNHIDHNPENNAIWNLEWCTPMENSHAANEYYGGSCANKQKMLGKSIIMEETEQQSSVLDLLVIS